MALGLPVPKLCVRFFVRRRAIVRRVEMLMCSYHVPGNSNFNSTQRQDLQVSAKSDSIFLSNNNQLDNAILINLVLF